MISELIYFKVDNVPLTVNYYREYLNFKLIEQDCENWNHASMEFYNKIISFNHSLNELQNSQQVIFKLEMDIKKLEKLYNTLKVKLKISKSLKQNSNGIYEFSIVDCNGYIICFQSNGYKN